MQIDWTFIEEKYQEILKELVDYQPVDSWQIKPLRLQATQHKTKYGMADINGVVYINSAFVNSSAETLLDATIRHELAHLCVGLEVGHGPVFKQKAKEFNSFFGRHLKSESAEINRNIGFKYNLYATLSDGQEVLLRKVHRKHRKYTQYKPSMIKYLTLKGQKIKQFTYK